MPERSSASAVSPGTKELTDQQDMFCFEVSLNCGESCWIGHMILWLLSVTLLQFGDQGRGGQDGPKTCVVSEWLTSYALRIALTERDCPVPCKHIVWRHRKCLNFDNWIVNITKFQYALAERNNCKYLKGDIYKVYLNLVLSYFTWHLARVQVIESRHIKELF